MLQLEMDTLRLHKWVFLLRAAEMKPAGRGRGERRCAAVRGAETKQGSIHRRTSWLSLVRLLCLFHGGKQNFFFFISFFS